MKLYTRRGDGGETDLFGGPRVGKDDLRVEAYGAVDEANSAVGVAAAASPHEDLRAICHVVQERLFDLGGTLATPRVGCGARCRHIAPWLAFPSSKKPKIWGVTSHQDTPYGVVEWRTTCVLWVEKLWASNSDRIDSSGLGDPCG